LGQGSRLWEIAGEASRENISGSKTKEKTSDHTTSNFLEKTQKSK